jgi:hypothetical protein
MAKATARPAALTIDRLQARSAGFAASAASDFGARGVN